MADWRVGAARDLSIVQRDSWDGDAARARLFGDGDEINQERAKRGHLVHDAEAPDVRGSYKLPFADVVDGELVAVDAGLRAAASRLPQADLPDDVKEKARAVLDAYFRRMEEDGKGASAHGAVHKTMPIQVERKWENGGRIVINTAALDRDRDRVLPKGARLDNYLKNPVVQWGHNYWEPWATIGRTTSLEVTDEGIVAEFELRPAANEQDPQNVVRLLWDGGWVRTASVGFNPVSARENEQGGMDFEEWELLEWSLVPIPANQEALRLAVKGLVEHGSPIVWTRDGTNTIVVEHPKGVDITGGAEGGDEAGVDSEDPATTDDNNELTPEEEEALVEALAEAMQAIANVLQPGE